MNLIIPEYGLVIWQTLMIALTIGMAYLFFRAVRYFLRADSAKRKIAKTH